VSSLRPPRTGFIGRVLGAAEWCWRCFLWGALAQGISVLLGQCRWPNWSPYNLSSPPAISYIPLLFRASRFCLQEIRIVLRPPRSWVSCPSAGRSRVVLALLFCGAPWPRYLRSPGGNVGGHSVCGGHSALEQPSDGGGSVPSSPSW